MPHTRRGFLKFLGATAAAPFVVNATLLSEKKAAQVLEEAPGLIDADLATTTKFGAGIGARDGSGSTYQMIHAKRTLKRGEVVCVEQGRPFGVAMADITAGNYGFVQVSGPTTVQTR